MLLTGQSHNDYFGTDAWFQVNPHFDSQGHSEVRVRTAVLHEAKAQTYRNKLIRAASEAAIVDASIVRSLKSKLGSDPNAGDETFICRECKEEKAAFHFSKTQQEKEDPRCKVCISRSTKAVDPVLESSNGMRLDELYEAVLSEVDNRIVLSQHRVAERLRRLADEGVVKIDPSGTVHFQPAPVIVESSPSPPEEVVSPSATQTKPRPVPVRRQVSRQTSIQVAPILVNDEEIDPLEAGGGELIRLISHAERLPEHYDLHFKRDLEFVPDALDQPEFVSRGLLLHDLSLVTHEVTERLHVSQARALALLSDPKVRWNHRVVSLTNAWNDVVARVTED